MSQLELLSLRESQPVADPHDPPSTPTDKLSMGHRERLALRKLGNPAGFEFYRWEAVGDAVVMRGCVCSGATYTKGKDKGRIKYDGPQRTVVVTEAEEAAERARFVQETGKCGECCGDGREFARWDHIEGTTYRPCRKCKGSGVDGEN
jgi:hypothetical protein